MEALDASLTQTAYPSCMKVLMLNPKVGLTVMISSPLSRFKMVVFPALSSPLHEHGISVAGRHRWSESSQKEDPHFPLLPPVLADNRKKTHVVNVPVRWAVE